MKDTTLNEKIGIKKKEGGPSNYQGCVGQKALELLKNTKFQTKQRKSHFRNEVEIPIQ